MNTPTLFAIVLLVACIFITTEARPCTFRRWHGCKDGKPTPKPTLETDKERRIISHFKNDLFKAMNKIWDTEEATPTIKPTASTPTQITSR